MYSAPEICLPLSYYKKYIYIHDMKIINFSECPSLVSQYLMEMRNVDIQGDMLRFRENLARVGEKQDPPIQVGCYKYASGRM